MPGAVTGKTGFIGLGLMGAHMARNLLEAGFELVVHNRSPKAVDALVANGARGAVSPAALAKEVDAGIIITCVTDTPALEAVFGSRDGGHGLLSALVPGALVIDMGTTGVHSTRALARQVETLGCHMIDAPVSGGEIGARAGSLSIMAGGHDEAIGRAHDIFEVLGSIFTHIGPAGTGQIAKAANQLIVGETLIAVGEGLALAHAAGAEPAKVREALLGGFAGSRILDVHGARMIDEAFSPGGRAKTQLKDIDQALELAEQSGLDLTALKGAQEMWREMVKRGWGDLDQAGIYKLINTSGPGRGS